jgi:hypothetical protein
LHTCDRSWQLLIPARVHARRWTNIQPFTVAPTYNTHTYITALAERAD